LQTDNMYERFTKGFFLRRKVLQMDTFSSRHYIVIIFTTTIVSLKTYPTVYLIYGKRDSWIAMIIASLMFFLFFMTMIKIWKKAKVLNMVEMYTKALGNKAGKVFIYLFISTLLLTLTESAAVEANSMRSNMLLDTPVWYFLLFFIFPCLYMVRQDIVAIVIICVVMILLIFLSGINLAILTAKYKRFEYLFPVLEEGINLNFIICIVKIFGLYSCIAISIPYLSIIEDKLKLTRDVVIALLVVIQMQIVSVSGLVMTFAPQYLTNLSYPKLTQTQLVSYQRFLEYGELYVLFQMLGGWLLKYIVTFYALLLLLKDLNFSTKKLKIAAYSISLLVYIGSYYLARDTFFLFRFLSLYSFICLLSFALIPFCVFIRYSVVVKKF
jgi:spore germination protein (amino acid permease)